MKCIRYSIAGLRNESGAALIEFAFSLPVLIILLVGILEISNYVYSGQKAQSAAENILNIMNLQGEVSTAQLNSMSQMVPEITKPLIITPNDYEVIVTAMQRDVKDSFAYVRWQKKFGNAAGGESQFHYTTGASKASNQVSPNAMGGFTFLPNDQVIVVEVYMRYNSLMSNAIVDNIYSLNNSFIYFATPPARPRSGSFQFDPDDAV